MLADARFGYREQRSLRTRELLVRQDQTGLLTDGSGKSVSSFMTQNPPEHTRLRRFAAPAFTTRSVERLRLRVTDRVNALLDKIIGAGEINLVEAFANPLPFGLICEILGIPVTDRALVKRCSDIIALGLDPDFLVPQEIVAQRVHDMLEIAAYFRELAAERRRRPQQDLMSALVKAGDGGDALTPAEVVATCTLFLVAGHASTSSFIASGVLALLDHPDQLALIRGEPDLTANAVEELLRYDAPVQTLFRTALADVTLGDTVVPAGTKVMALLGAANRDPGQFADPDRLDLTRTGSRHLSFSQGTHFCLGAMLARLQATIALRCLMDRTSIVELADQPRWKPNFSLRGPESLPVTLGAA